MSSLTHESMINSHSPGLFTRLSETLHLWRARQRQRRELAQFTDYQLHDVGLSWGDVIREVKKPFWRP